MTLADRLRAHDPVAVREVHDAITAARGVLVGVGARLTGGSGTPSTQARAAGRLVALAGLDEHLAAVQTEHGTGQRGRPVKRRARLTVQITGAALDVLSPATRAACVDDRGPGAPWAIADIELDASGRVMGRLVREG